VVSCTFASSRFVPTVTASSTWDTRARPIAGGQKIRSTRLQGSKLIWASIKGRTLKTALCGCCLCARECNQKHKRLRQKSARKGSRLHDSIRDNGVIVTYMPMVVTRDLESQRNSENARTVSSIFCNLRTSHDHNRVLTPNFLISNGAYTIIAGLHCRQCVRVTPSSPCYCTSHFLRSAL